MVKIEKLKDEFCSKIYDFSAENFIEELITNGNKINCDETSTSFNKNMGIPWFYNEKLFKSGQKFYHKHIFAMFFSKLLGLLVALTTPSVIAILKFTNQSSSNLKSYKRYMETIFHMCMWYDEDFKPGTKSWKSLLEVRNKHKIASKRSCAAGLKGITQYQMALTQFGFMGMALTKKENVGIHEATEEEWKSFIHVWRVFGHVMGIEDRFNICRDSIEETTEICKLLIDKIFVPQMKNKNTEFIEMSNYLLNGLWCFNPILHIKVFLNLLYLILLSNNTQISIRSKEYFILTKLEHYFLRFIVFVINNLKYSILRVLHNYIHRLSLQVMQFFPFLAYYKFGKKNSCLQLFSIKT